MSPTADNHPIASQNFKNFCGLIYAWVLIKAPLFYRRRTLSQSLFQGDWVTF